MSAVVPVTLPSYSYESLLAMLSDRLGRARGSQALLLVDFENPTAVQARLGYEASATLVGKVADNLSVTLGGRGTVFRLGDTSCCVLIGAILNNGHAMLAAEKLALAADVTMSDAGLAVRPRLSIGIALYPRDATEPGTLLRKSQLASAAARRRAERTLVYDEGCAEQVMEADLFGEAFREALEMGALAVHYQPKVHIADGRVAGVEALMRWLRDGKPVATPDVFIPQAERAGLIHDTTWYTLGNALRMSAEFNGLGVAVNVTPGMLHHGEFIEMVQTAVRSWSVPRGALTLELTEGALVVDFDEAMARLKRVRELGVRISIDDFGTGYSSLSYFKKIPADEIKIDRSFVKHMLTDAADLRLVKAIVTLAQQFDLQVVAEGVEDRETLAELAALGCDYAQGFHFSPALDTARLREWLDRHAAAQREPGQRSPLP